MTHVRCGFFSPSSPHQLIALVTEAAAAPVTDSSASLAALSAGSVPPLLRQVLGPGALAPKAALPAEVRLRLRANLIDPGPHVVIVDEAHCLANAKVCIRLFPC